MPRKTDISEKKRVKLRGLGQLYPRGDNWHVAFSVNGQQFRESTHTDKYNEAVAFLKKRIGEIQSGSFTSTKTDRVMVSELLQDVLDDYRVKGRNAKKMAQPIITQHLLPAFRHMRASNLKLTQLRAYVSDQQAAGMAPASINRHMSLLRRAYSLGLLAGKVNVANMPKFKELRLEENNVREGFWEHDEYTRFRDALPEDERGVFVFGYWTGCRYSEITHLLWEQVDLEQRIVKLRKGTTKNKQARLIPLGKAGLGDLLDMLTSQKARHASLCPESPWVFFRRGGAGPASRRRGQRVAEIKKPFYAAQEETGVNKSFHDLRRTGVRNLVRAGVPQSVAKRISGHLTDSVFQRYDIVDERDLQDAAEAVAKYVTAKAGGNGEGNGGNE